MRIIILLLFCIISSSVSAQDDPDSPNGSVGIQVSKNAIGAFGEYFIKPNMSIWMAAGARYTSVQLGYGVDTNFSAINFPAEIEDIKNAQTTYSIRSGVRFYVPFNSSKLSFWASPFLGFSGRSDPSDEYQTAFDRADLNSSYTRFPLLASEQFLEAGVELGLRWNFARKFYAQASFMGYWNVALSEEDSIFDRDGTIGVGYRF